MTHKATKIVIITEKLIQDGVARIIQQAGASGYTVVAAGGKGSRGVRSSGRPAVVDAFANVKIEVITSNREMADRIADEVAATYFENYSGITYLEEVEVLRPHKF
ncbi:P-II family nitrogen regulator [Algihabitans sp.]|uniref:P-II family nitrogen regulator n=1 Tax=Algihabitans sp. TaxID=2821514 RepID=UPI003BACC3A2